MKNRPLRMALAANLVFSSACGLALIFGGGAVAAWLGTIPAWFMMALGVGLLGFAGLLGFVLARLRVGWALLISVLDILWVLATLPLTLIPGLLTPEGKVAVVVVAACVALFAFLQLRGIRSSLDAGADNPGTYRHCVRVQSRARPDDLWRAVRDLGAIAQYAPGLSESKLVGAKDPRPGATRVCTNHQGQSWAEDVVCLDDRARTVLLRFQTEAPDFPLPFSEMEGGWIVAPAPNDRATVDIWWTVRPKMPRFGWVVLALMTIPLDRDIPRIVAAMEADGEDDTTVFSSRLPALSIC